MSVITFSIGVDIVSISRDDLLESPDLATNIAGLSKTIESIKLTGGNDGEYQILKGKFKIISGEISAKESIVDSIAQFASNGAEQWSGSSLNLRGDYYLDFREKVDSIGLRNFITKGNDTIIGSKYEDVIGGRDGNDHITGMGGADRLTGGKGKDTFRYTKLSESRLAAYDRITDFAIGTDSIDAPRAVSKSNVRELGRVSRLNQREISNVLTNSTFKANHAATFTFGSGSTTRTFVALNDNRAGFDANRDALIEITGYSGNLADLAII